MGAKTEKMHSFIKELQEMERGSQESREKAALLMLELIGDQELHIFPANDFHAENVMQKAQEAHDRLEDINNRLELTIKGGLANGTVH